MRCSSGRIHKCRIALHFLDHLFVFFVRFYGRYAEGYDFDSAKSAPFFRKNFVKSVRHFRGVSRKCGIADSHCGNLCKCRLERCKKFALELAVKLASLILICYVSAYVGIEKYRVRKTVAVFAEAADCDIDIDSRSFINYSERYRARSSVFVSNKFLGVEVIYSLVLCCISAEGETFSDSLKRIDYACSEFSAEDGRLGGHIICIFAGFCADINYFSLFNNAHALAVRYCDYRTVGNDIIFALGVGTSSACSFFTFCCKHVRRNCLTVKILFPLICQYSADCSAYRFYKSHNSALSFFM